ncbi:MAG: DUF4834 family protein [Prevotella sp.]|nr:DUF4834 family protein [Prevotella sp.]
MIFIKLIILAGLFMLVKGLFSLVGTVNQMRKTAENMRSQFENEYQQRSQTYANSEGVVDPNGRERSQKKIIPSDEGEYVDYEVAE